MFKLLLQITVLNILLLSCTGKKETPFPENAAVERIADGFSFTEGPTSDSEGNVYFTDQPNNLIYKYTIEGELDTFTTESGRSNGLYIDQENQLWACADKYNQLWKFDLNGNMEIILNPEGKPVFNGPNDVWVHTNGDVYFTDPYYKRPYWSEPHDTLVFQGIYLLREGMDAPVPVLLDSTLVQPNGIVGNSDKNLLYVADIGADKTYRYNIMQDGTLANKEMLIEQGSDGMTLDNSGNIYLTGKGVDVFNSNGKAIRHLNIPEEWTANICFGGEENNRLFITASKGLYSLQTNVKGVF